ncbi:MAG: chemotaxis protein [Lachnospiraceae bacterium]|nr:chemotaxis protein [Lachnospiraceae bacterium]
MAKKKEEEVPAGSPAWMATFSDLMNLLLCFFVLLFSMSSTDAQKYADVAASLSESFNNTISIFENQKQDSVVDLEAFPKNVQQVNNFEEYEEDTSEQDSKRQNSDTESQNASEIAKELNEAAATELYEGVSEYIEKGQIENKVDLAMDKNFFYVKLSISGSLLFSSGHAEIKEESKVLLDRIGTILKNYQGNLIKIEGHTDNVPITKSKEYTDNMELSYARAYEVWKYMVNEKKLEPKRLEASGRSEYDPVADNSTSKGRAVNRRVEFKIYTDLVKDM